MSDEQPKRGRGRPRIHANRQQAWKDQTGYEQTPERLDYKREWAKAARAKKKKNKEAKMTNEQSKSNLAQLVKRLAAEDYRSIPTNLFNLDDWMKLAFLLSKGGYSEIHQKPIPMMVERIQILLVESNIVSDSFFVFLLNRKRNLLSRSLQHLERLSSRLFQPFPIG